MAESYETLINSNDVLQEDLPLEERESEMIPEEEEIASEEEMKDHSRDGCINSQTREPQPCRGQTPCDSSKSMQRASVTDASDAEKTKLRHENQHLRRLNSILQQQLEVLREGRDVDIETATHLREHVSQLQADLDHSKQCLTGTRDERKKLRVEKLDLLNQMKQLYGMVEERDRELRDFIRNYEQRMEETNNKLKQLVLEKQESQREKWALLRRAHDASEQVVRLRTQLSAANDQARGEVVCKTHPSLTSPTTCISRNTKANSNGQTKSRSMDRMPRAYSTDLPSPSYPDGTDVIGWNKSPRRNASSHSLSRDGSLGKLKKEKAFGSLSRLFSKRPRKHGDACSSDADRGHLFGSYRRGDVTDKTSEKLRLMEEARTSPLEDWKQPTLLTWLDVSLHMNAYHSYCAQNVKNGKVMAGLTDIELETLLGISNRMHKKKLILAIEDAKHPLHCRYQKISGMDDVWVTDVWLPSVGLGQYSDLFRMNLVDGRVLNTLKKKELEKYFNISRKFHQASIFCAVDLLRMFRFNKQEYSGYLSNSGVHGALIVMEKSFDADTLATVLNIPVSKLELRRQLASEFDALMNFARAAYDIEQQAMALPPAGLNRSNSFFQRAGMSPTRAPAEKNKKRSSLRGSLGRAFGRMYKQQRQHSSTGNLRDHQPTSSNPMISSDEYRIKSRSVDLDSSPVLIYHGTTV
ncbi:PREDICTED: kazrin-like [Priapulus caudatus]|uniref:Kazrin-like n=1 Tax=Priapulus caudatus TaxID=37621 RepID=A0ABM1EAL0_PRICU|nr:PREDICTED: kazrin-like [Priapulus caudatus]